MGIVYYLENKLKKRVKKISRFYKFNVTAPWIAFLAEKKIKQEKNKGLFLDCGSNIGQGFSFFNKHFKSEHFDYELFEPNPNCLPFLEKIKVELNHNIVIHSKALSDHNGFLKFYGLSEPKSGGALSQGGSILPEHNSGTYASDENAAIEVEAIDFAEFLKGKIDVYRTIVIKMDIEGGEYQVLDHLLQQGLFVKVHSIFCEFHSEYMSLKEREKFRKKELEITDAIKATGCKFNLWI